MPIRPKYVGCKEAGCKRGHYAHGLCSKHYQTYRLHKQASGDWDTMKRGFRESCSVAGCSGKHLAEGLCCKHYTREIKRRNREFILARYFPNGVVCKCGKTLELIQMDAHHPDPKVKEYTLSVLLNNSALQDRPQLVAELDQCEFICTRCHQNLHHDPATTHEETYLRKDKGRRIDGMKAVVRKIFGEKCMSCGDWLYPKEMEFHHRNPDDKTDNVSDLMRIATKETVIREVSKCEIVCRNCHRLKLEAA